MASPLRRLSSVPATPRGAWTTNGPAKGKGSDGADGPATASVAAAAAAVAARNAQWRDDSDGGGASGSEASAYLSSLVRERHKESVDWDGDGDGDEDEDENENDENENEDEDEDENAVGGKEEDKEEDKEADGIDEGFDEDGHAGQWMGRSLAVRPRSLTTGRYEYAFCECGKTLFEQQQQQHPILGHREQHEQHEQHGQHEHHEHVQSAHAPFANEHDQRTGHTTPPGEWQGRGAGKRAAERLGRGEGRSLSGGSHGGLGLRRRAFSLSSSPRSPSLSAGFRALSIDLADEVDIEDVVLEPPQELVEEIAVAEPQIRVSASRYDDDSAQAPSSGPSATPACRRCGREDCVAVRPTVGLYTLEQIQRHTTADDCWVTAHGMVFDVTRYLKKHPGGPKSILARCGVDASDDYDFHSKLARRKLWAKYKIGNVAVCGNKPKPKPRPRARPRIRAAPQRNGSTTKAKVQAHDQDNCCTM